MEPSIKDIYKNIIQHYLKPTPLQKSKWLSQYVDGDIYLKLENLNPNGSFKVRGALNAISVLHAKHTKKNSNVPMKVVAASAGNHSQGVAFAAKQLGCEAHLFLPETASPLKKIATEKLGAHIYIKGKNFEEAFAAAEEFSKKENAYFINAFNDKSIILGQATCALESHQQFKDHPENINKLTEPDYFMCSIGGGGLAAGACLYFEQNCHTKVIGVEHTSFNSAFKSLRKKSLESADLSIISTIADGIALKTIGTITFKYLLKYMKEIITVSEDDIYHAIAKIYKNDNIVVEGAGGASVAAVLKQPEIFKNKSTILCISGGNIDPDVFQKVLQYTKDKL